uniref:Uncharacterized protein n=1 Tax=Anguilla anguilla TaxID=7936 RepID=A0A0E9VNM9_ANGAN
MFILDFQTAFFCKLRFIIKQCKLSPWCLQKHV